MATTQNHSDAVRQLLDAGARLDARDESGMTPTMYAKAYKRRAVESILRTHAKRAGGKQLPTAEAVEAPSHTAAAQAVDSSLTADAAPGRDDSSLRDASPRRRAAGAWRT